MKKLIAGYLSLCVVCAIIYIPVYWLFFDSAEDAVKSVSLADGIYFGVQLTTDTKSEEKEKRQLIKDFAKEYKKASKIDIDKPIYKVLDSDSDVKDLSVVKVNQVSNSEAVYAIVFKYKGEKKTIPFAVTEPSLTKMRRANSVVLLPLASSIKGIGQFYKMSTDDINRTSNLFHKMLPNR